jgi:hypothetical protein
MSSAASTLLADDEGEVAVMAATAVQASTTASVIEAMRSGRSVGPRMRRTVSRLLSHLHQLRTISKAAGPSGLFNPHVLVLNDSIRYEGFARLAATKHRDQMVKSYARLFELIDSVHDDGEGGEIDIIDPGKADELASYLRQLSAFLSDYLREEVTEPKD